MRNVWKKKRVRLSLISFGLILSLLIATSAYFRIYSKGDITAYYGMMKEINPVWKDFALRRIKEGDPIENLVQLKKPGDLLTIGDDQRVSNHRFSSFSPEVGEGQVYIVQYDNPSYHRPLYRFASKKGFKEFLNAIKDK